MKGLLLQLTVSHQYYTQGIGDKLSLVPESQTQAFIERYQLLLFSEMGHLSLYHMGQGSADDFINVLRQLLGEQPLVFELISNDTDFAIITDLPVDWRGQLDFSSENISPAPSPDTPVSMQMALNATVLPRGGAIGKVSFFAADLALNRCFDISLKARQTHWHYYVFNRNNLQLNDPVVTNTQGFEFENSGKVTLQNGEEAILFSSAPREFPMQGSDETRFDLVNRLAPASVQTGFASPALSTQTNSKTLIKGLPIPKKDRIDMTTQNGQPYIYSPMYIYL